MLSACLVLSLVIGLFATSAYADAPSAPAGASATFTANSAQVSWSSVENATAYNVYRSTAEVGPYVLANAAPVAGTTYTDAALAADTAYYYKVSAIGAEGESALSDSASGSTTTDFGPNVKIYDPTMSVAAIQAEADGIFAAQETAEFGTDRYALLFKPGTYDNLNVRVGFFTQVAGLGRNPDDVQINGGVTADAAWDSGNATRNFWRSVENLAFTQLDLTKSPPTAATAKWAVSQAAPMRRVHVKSNLWLWDLTPSYEAGWASGGFIADSVIDGTITPASQQQFFSRNNSYPTWTNGVWNMVFVGDSAPPAGTFPTQPYTVIDRTPVVKEKPYLYVKPDGDYAVFVPSLEHNKQGVSWAGGSTSGASVPISEFYIADPATSTAADVNKALAGGKNVIFTPGIYHFDQTIQVNNPNAIVMGLGYASIMPTNGQTALKVADVDGVSVSSLFFIAGPATSPALMEVGTPGSHQDHAANPTLLADLFFSIGGLAPGSADVGLVIHSDDVIGDHFWSWRADHGAGASWSTNVSRNGLVVNGDDVTLYGLFNEHHEEYQTVWNGNGGRLYFYQSEIPYDPPAQEAWMSHGGTANGYASYKIADGVTSHEAWGLGIYSYFRDAPVKLENAIEAPNTEGIKLDHLTTIWLNGQAGSEITHIVNGQGGRVYGSNGDAMRQTMNDYAPGDVTPPTVPAGLVATAVSGKQIDLAWGASTDNVGVQGYDVYRDGVRIGTANGLAYSDGGLKPKTAYTYTVVAKDSAGNASAASGPASATTQRELSAFDQSGWIATASQTGGGTTTAGAIDGNTGTKWTTGAPMVGGQWFALDMGKANSVARIQIDAPSGSGDYARGYEIYAANAADFSDAALLAGDAANTGTTVAVDLPEAVSFRYLKIVQTGTSGSWWAISEIGIFTDAVQSLDRTGWTVSTNPATDTAPLIDGNPSSRWSSGTAMAPGQWITIDTGGASRFSKLILDSRGSNNDYARGLNVYASNDNESWASLAPIATVVGKGPFTVIEFPEQTARYIRIEQTATNASWWSIYEINAYGVPEAAPIAVSSIAVAGEGGATAIAAKGGALRMIATVLPADAANADVVWSVVGTEATIGADGLLTALKNGAVKVLATAADGSGVSGSAIIEISGQAPVANITVVADGGVTTIAKKNGNLQLRAVVLPAGAGNVDIVWEVYGTDNLPTDIARVNPNGKLKAERNGTVVVVARAADGSGAYGTIVITISGQK